jgi:hypothetical protein
MSDEAFLFPKPKAFSGFVLMPETFASLVLLKWSDMASSVLPQWVASSSFPGCLAFQSLHGL